MGTGASTQVKSIDIDSKQRRERSPDNCPEPSPVKELNVEKSKDDDDDMHKFTQRIKDLEKKLAESDSENLDLQERIQILEERLTERLQVIPEEEDVCMETVQAKDQYIAKLDAELLALQQENTKMKVKYKKKLKILTAKLSEAKQESSIQMFEQKDELSRLKEENQQLICQLNQTSDPGSAGSEVTPSISGHMTLILDLSQQVSEQGEKIRKLEENLKEKNRIIKKFRSTESSNTDGTFSDLKDDVLVSMSWNEETHPETNSEFTGWRRANESGLRRTGHQSQELAPVEESNIEEVKQLCRSRDSGLGSAGKSKTPHKAQRNVSKRIASASSLLLGLHEDSDSDWGSDSSPSSQYKAQSAPPGSRSPHLLSTSGREELRGDNLNCDSGTPTCKSKKKKSHLKRRVDKIPECRPSGSTSYNSELLGPTIAFIETT